MRGMTIEEWQLLSFFEVEPTLEDPEEPWSCNSASYEVIQDDHVIRFGIAPFYQDVSIEVSNQGTKILEMVALSVEDVRYLRVDGVEQLLIVLSQQNGIELTLRPRLTIKHRYRGKQ
jgi:hypothetical protein